MCKWGTYKTVRLCKPKEVSKRTEIPVDACIADIIQALNNMNIETITSCCSHFKGLGEIVLADGRTLLIKDKDWTIKSLELMKI